MCKENAMGRDMEKLKWLCKKWISNAIKTMSLKGAYKELIGMAHGHEQWYGDCLRESGALKGAKGRKLGQLQ